MSRYRRAVPRPDTDHDPLAEVQRGGSRRGGSATRNPVAADKAEVKLPAGDCPRRRSGRAAQLLLARALDLGRTPRQPLAISPGQRFDIDRLESFIDAAFYRAVRL